MSDSKEGTNNTAEINQVLDVPAFLAKQEASPKAYLIDVRTPEEYQEGAIPKAKNIDFYGDNFKNEMMQLDKQRPVMVYCKSGGRSGKTAKLLSQLGFGEVYDLRGGYTAYAASK